MIITTVVIKTNGISIADISQQLRKVEISEKNVVNFNINFDVTPGEKQQ